MRIESEAVAQAQLMAWAQFMSSKYPELELLFHIPNGGSRNKIEAANLKRQGVKAGVPDLCLPVARGKYHGLYIELKVKGNKPTELQKEWNQKLRDQGYRAEICYEFEGAQSVILEYLKSTQVDK